MGDAAVSALVKEVVGRLTSEAIKEFGLLWGLKDDISTLKDDFERIEAVLEDAEEKHSKEKAIELWLKSLRSASLTVENVLDEISTQALLQRLHKERGIKHRVRAFFSKAVFYVKIAHKVKDIRRKLDFINSKKSELSLTRSAIGHVDVDVVGEMPDRETSSLIHDSSAIFGRNEEVEIVTEKICNKDIGKHENGEIRVYGIWGMGGLGKTTLAQLVYNHEKMNKYFELKCWIYVSEKFQVKEIIKGIIESLDECECRLTQLDMLQDSLKSKIRGKKFLIVLDDVWIEDGETTKWEQLRAALSCGANESIVVMTTRSKTTSNMFAKVPELQNNLGCLSEEDSWLLFKKLAFAEGREGDGIRELEPIGREIVEKCKGLPLAVKTLGSLMWLKRSTKDWQLVKDNNIWELDEIKVLPAILKLSYDNLLPHLKRCFAYCCLFPKGYDMEKDVVIQLWIVNGFIPRRGELDLYVLGEEILNCLVWRSFFQVVKTNNYSERYKMHDLMHDMARHVMGDDCLVVEPGKEVIIPKEALHLKSTHSNFQFSTQDLGKLTSLRSIFLYQYSSISQCFSHVYLRVLNLSGICLETLPESICKLTYLKYLNLSHSSLKVLPESIMYLQNLQVLFLSSCKNLRQLPESICKIKHLKYLNLSGSCIEVLPKGLKYMTNLRYLDINSCYSLMHLPLEIKELTELRRLSRFPVGNKGGAKIWELEDLNLLEGELEILLLENVGDINEAGNANLKGKRNLSVLNLSWSVDSKREIKPETFAFDQEVLEELEPNPHLKRLGIFFYMGTTISPSWMVNLENLVEISFSFCRKCEHIPALGRLPNLRVINLRSMPSLKCFHDDDTNMLGDTTNMFLCLLELRIDYCQNLVSLPCNLPKLKVLKLGNCAGFLSLPDESQSFKGLKELEIINCKHLHKRYAKEIGVDWHKISHVPKINIYCTGMKVKALSR